MRALAHSRASRRASAAADIVFGLPFRCRAETDGTVLVVSHRVDIDEERIADKTHGALALFTILLGAIFLDQRRIPIEAFGRRQDNSMLARALSFSAGSKVVMAFPSGDGFL